ncbi:RTC4-like domain-containing protein [Thelonectria olida]|uniref:Restriction of telomere capping protein 4 n=1 Tax=Thelonectria olida TaxID=1576542 RepID=A0A9P8WKI7_9HYPO|nr:RTC4-like domain-containing protein [Thelonectria olida]
MRRAGLSYNQRCAPLLRRVGGRDVSDASRLSRKVADDAAPIGSSDEEDGDVTSPENPKKSRISLPKSDPESSGPESDKGAIKSTQFGAAKSSNSRETGTRNARKPRKGASAVDSSQEIPPSSIKRRRIDDEGPSSKKLKKSTSGDYLKDERGFVKKTKVKATYKPRSTSSQEPQTRIVKSEPKQKVKLKAAPDSDDLDSPKKPAKAKMRAVAELSFSSPSQSPTGKFVKLSQDTNEDLNDAPDSPIRKQVRLVTASQTRKSRHTKKIFQPIPTYTKPAKFVIPEDLPEVSRGSQEDNDGRSKSPLSTDLSDLSDLESQDDSRSAADASHVTEASSTTVTACPWCGGEVPEALLKEFSKGQRLNVRMQTRFCHKHKKQSALDTWRERSYPAEILWSDLKDRFDEHHTYLLKVVRGEPSHFRSILANKIETGKARNLKKEANLNPGYYGPRGFNLMCDYLVGEFGDMLKEKAVSDRVIAGRGSAAFIESVLVAELAVRLIQEDMDVSVIEARDILEESKALGDIIHEDV